MEPLEALSRSRAEFDRVVTAVGPDQWDGSTPCEPWNVRALVNHVVAGNRMAVGLLGGCSREEALATVREDALGDDPAAAFRAGAAKLEAAFAAPGAMEGTVHHPAADMPGAQFIGFRVTDQLLHAWDLARAIGTDETLDADVVAWLYQGMQARAADLAGSGMFGAGASGTLGHDAPLQDKLLDLTGRRP